MAALRYFGVKLADVELEGLRSDAALGRFVAIADPLPVGTTVELDGLPHRVTRVDEGLTPGFWVWGDGTVSTTTFTAATPEAIPEAIDTQATVPNASSADRSTEVSVEAEPAGEAEAVPSPAAAEKSEEGGRKRRRRGKTVLGR